MKNEPEEQARRQDPPDPWEPLARWIAGECDPDEAARIERRLAESPGDAQLVEVLSRFASRSAAGATADVDVEAALARVRRRLDDPIVTPLARERRIPIWRSSFIRIAAAVTLVVGGAFIWQALRGGSDSATPSPGFTYDTGTGEADTLRLPDGTQVMLGPGSRLSVAERYGELARNVELNGEALFDVVHDDARPFTVMAGGAAIRDLGTKFAVRSVGDGEVRVVVTEGSVVLRPSGVASDSVMLQAGDRGIIHGGGGAVAERSVAVEEDIAWTSGRLVFSNATVARVSADLRRWYGVELLIPDPLLSERHLTATFAGDPVERILDVIALALGAEIERMGDTAIVRMKSAGAGR